MEVDEYEDLILYRTFTYYNLIVAINELFILLFSAIEILYLSTILFYLLLSSYYDNCHNIINGHLFYS